MNQSELIAAIAEASGVTKAAAGEVLRSFVSIVEGELKDSGSIRVNGIGTFEVRNTPARQGRNPRTGETIEIPAGKTVKVKVASTLKSAVG